MHARRWLAAAMLAGFLVVTATAQGRSSVARAKFVGAAVAPAQTDGIRYAAFDIADDRTRVIDTETGRSFVKANPPTCARRTGFANLGVAGLGDGYLLWECYGQYPYGPHLDARIMEIRSHRVVRPAGIDAVNQSGSEGAGLTGIGSRWLKLITSGYHYSGAPSFLNWITGEQRYRDGTSRQVADLSSPDLAAPLCDPLERDRNPGLDDPYNAEGGTYKEYSYEAPFGLRHELPEALILDRCGSGHHTRLSECRRGCLDAQLGAGVVTWSATVGRKTSVFAFDATTGRERTVRFKRYGEAAHTRKRVYYSVPTSKDPYYDPQYGIYEVDLRALLRS
jgi:hypothetical protein